MSWRSVLCSDTMPTELLSWASIWILKDVSLVSFPYTYIWTSTIHLGRRCRDENWNCGLNSLLILGQGLLISVDNTVTKVQSKRKHCLITFYQDFCTKTFHPFSASSRLFCIPSTKERHTFRQLTSIEEFYKFSYAAHIEKDGDMAECLQKSLLLTGKKRYSLTDVSSCHTFFLLMKLLECISATIFTEACHLEDFHCVTERLYPYPRPLHSAIVQEAWISEYVYHLKQRPARTMEK